MKTKHSSEYVVALAIEDLLRTGDLEGVLRRYSAQSAALQPLLEEVLVLRYYYAQVSPPPAGLTIGRERMLEEARRLRQSFVKDRNASRPVLTRRFGMSTIFASRLLGIVLACALGMAALGVSGVAAARQSLPGEVLYPAKLALETVSLELAPSPQERVTRALTQVDTRIAELAATDEAGRSLNEEVVATIRGRLRFALQAAAQAPATDVPHLLQQIAERTQMQAQTLQQLQERVRERNRIHVQNARQFCQQIHDEAIRALQDPQLFRYRYQRHTGTPDRIVTPPSPAADPEPQVGERLWEQVRERQQEQQQDQQQEQLQEQSQQHVREQQQSQQEIQEQSQQREREQQQQAQNQPRTQEPQQRQEQSQQANYQQQQSQQQNQYQQPVPEPSLPPAQGAQQNPGSQHGQEQFQAPVREPAPSQQGDIRTTR